MRFHHNVFLTAVVAALAVGPARAQTAPASKPAPLSAERQAKAREWIKLAETAAAGKRSFVLDYAWRDIAAAQASLGDIAAARKTLDFHDNVSNKVDTLSTIAGIQFKSGDAAGAKQTIADALKLAGTAPDDLLTIGKAQLDCGDIAAARLTSQRMKASSELAELLCGIGEAQAKAKDLPAARTSFTTALKVIKDAKEDLPSFEEFHVVAAQARAGEFAAAKATAQLIPEKEDQALSLLAIARVQAERGEIPAVRATLADARRVNPAPNAHFLLGAGYAHARARDFANAKTVLAEARKLAEAMDPQSQRRPAVLFAIALQQDEIEDPAASGTYKAAQTALSALTDKAARAHILWEMAMADASSGLAKDATDFVNRAMKEDKIDDVAFMAAAITEGVARTLWTGADLAWVNALPAEAKASAYAAAAMGIVSSRENPLLARLATETDAGSTYALFRLGCLYDDGEGVVKDYAQAMAWYKKAADKGDETAMAFIGVLYHNGRGVPVDDAQAMVWFRKAADLGNKFGMWEVATIYRHGGKGVAQNYPQAMIWYKKAAEAGDAGSNRDVGEMYRDALGVPQDYAQAMTWLQKAAAQDDAQAMRDIAEFHERGNGVPKDPAKAREWYKKAADAGDKDAKTWLSQQPEK